MEHIRKEAHAIAELEDTPPTTKEDILLEKTINKEVAEMQQTAYEADDWKPDMEDVATTVKYLRSTYTKGRHKDRMTLHQTSSSSPTESSQTASSPYYNRCPKQHPRPTPGDTC